MSQELTLHIDFNAPVTLPGVKAAVRKFLTWWADELLCLLPIAWRERLTALFRTPVLILEKKKWRLRNFSGVDDEISFAVDMAPQDVRQELEQQARDVLANSVEAQLASDDTLLRRVSLPAAAAGRLRSVMRLQLDRLSPFRGDDVSFDCAIVGRGNDGTIAVDVAIVPRTRLQAYERRMRAIGLMPRCFRIAGSSLKFAPTGLPWTKQRQTEASLAIVGVLLWLGAFFLAPLARNNEIGALSAEISALSPQMEKAQSVRTALYQYQLPPAALSTDRQPALALLAVLTKCLPDNVHVTDFSFEDGVLTISGTTSAPIKIVRLLSKTNLFSRIKATHSGPGTFALKAMLRHSSFSTGASNAL